MKLSVLLIAFVSFFLAACSGGGGGKSAPAKMKIVCEDGKVKDLGGNPGIIGGQTLNKDTWLARGLVYIVMNDEYSCTGTLVDTNVVLTAAHCVDLAYYPSDIKIYFTHQPACDRESGKISSVGSYAEVLEIHEDWNAQDIQAGNDLALVRFRGQAPQGFQPLKLTTEFIPTPEGSRIVVTGYGRTVPYQKKPDVESSFVRVATVGPMTAKHKAKMMDLYQKHGAVITMEEMENSETDNLLWIDQSQGKGVCSGDSGGPALMKNDQGAYVVMAVASAVGNYFDPEFYCGGIAKHTSVSFYKNWIEGAYQKIRNWDSQKTTLF